MKHFILKQEISSQEQSRAPVSTQAGFNSMLGFVKSDNDINFNKNIIYENSFHFDLEKINLVIADDGTLKQHQSEPCLFELRIYTNKNCKNNKLGIVHRTSTKLVYKVFYTSFKFRIAIT